MQHITKKINEIKELCFKAFNDEYLIKNYDQIVEKNTKGILKEIKKISPDCHKCFEFTLDIKNKIKKNPYLKKSLIDMLGYFSLFGSFEYVWDKKREIIILFEKSKLFELSETKIKTDPLTNIQQGKLIKILLNPKNTRNRIRGVNQKLRYKIFQRNDYTCVDCGAKGMRAGGSAILHIDHIIPIAFGGSNSESNLRTLCRKCNLKKSDKI